MRFRFLPTVITLLVFCLTSVSVQGDELHIATPEDWSQWNVAGDLFDMAGGRIQPRFVRRDIDAVENAELFSGGIRGAGTDRLNAYRLIDGDSNTFWSPHPNDPIESWWIEVDLGRVVSARQIRVQFSEQGQPIEFFKILTSDGTPILAGSYQPGTVWYNEMYNYGFNEDRLIEIDFALAPLRYIRIQAERKTEDVHLSELQVETMGDNLALGILSRGGTASASFGERTSGRFLEAGLRVSDRFIDGDITTATGEFGSEGGILTEPLFGQYDLDLGAIFWIDRIRLLGALPFPSGQYMRGFIWYQLYGSADALAPDGSRRWTLMAESPADLRNPDITDLVASFPLQKRQFLRFLFPLSDGLERIGGTIAIAEFQVFGEGFPAKLVIRSPVYDLRGSKNMSTLEWVSETPAGTRLELTSRSGNLLQEHIMYRDKNGQEVTEKQWRKLIPSFRGQIDTLYSGVGDDWTNWSTPYRVSGQSFLSANPRQYVQLEAHFLSDDPLCAASLNAITLHFADPLVQQTRGEIFPTEVTPGVSTDFTYSLRNTLTSDNSGFNRILISGSTDMEFKGLRADGIPAAVEVERVEEGLRIRLESVVRDSRLIEIDFRIALFQQTRFDVFLFNDRIDAAIRQKVDPGDATESVASEQVTVSLALTDRLLDRVALSRSVISPNQDGVGDQLRIEFNLLELSDPRPVGISVFDLSGRLVRRLAQTDLTAGPQSLKWDGQDLNGDLVPPGFYILKIEVKGDEMHEAVTRLISVVY